MDMISKDDRDVHLRSIIKSNLVCGDVSKIDDVTDAMLKDILDLLENYEMLCGK